MAPSPTRGLVVSTIADAGETPRRLGSASYSYSYVAQGFRPFLRRWGAVFETVRPGERPDAVVRRVTREQSSVVHLGFLPLEAFHPAAAVPNVAFPFWDFPDLLDDWARIANGLDLILTSSDFTRDAFVRAGVRTPIHTVPVPPLPEYFALPLHENGRVVLDCACYRVQPASSPIQAPRSRAKRLYQTHVRPRLSHRGADTIRSLGHALAGARRGWRDRSAVAHPVNRALELMGVVYTTVFNPFDQRKNWADLVTAYLLALQDCDDATLVIKLVVPPARAALGVNTLLRFHRQLGLDHRCHLVVVSDYLNDEQMLELARGSTYYLNSSRAEGACLPLQSFLAAARPAIAPRHTAIAECFQDDSGFPVASHPEPTSWPQDPDHRCTTTWHRLVWTSLRDQIRESYRVVKDQPSDYERRATNARARMAALAGPEPVWTRLSAALNTVAPAHRPLSDVRAL